jgi:hypothetical protein
VRGERGSEGKGEGGKKEEGEKGRRAGKRRKDGVRVGSGEGREGR